MCVNKYIYTHVYTYIYIQYIFEHYTLNPKPKSRKRIMVRSPQQRSCMFAVLIVQVHLVQVIKLHLYKEDY